ncbi:MAG: hypothetical protein R3C04_04045 [Hyphomonas sp.]
MLHNIAAIVEGDTEERFFKSILTRKCPVIYGIPNGMPGIGPCLDFIKDKIATLPGSIEHIFVLLDREKREANHLEISSQILEHLQGLHSAALYVGIPDRMIENWVCHFECGFKKSKPTHTKAMGVTENPTSREYWDILRGQQRLPHF